MKKYLILILLISIITLPVIGCTNSDVEKYNKKQENLENKEDQQQNNEGKGITVNKLTFTTPDYENLPADLQAMVNLEPKEGFLKVVQGVGDNKYVFISLGQRPTAGYEVKIESVEDVEGKISIVYSEKKPSKDEVVAQVITYPWKVLKIESPLPIGAITKQ